jgi:hypothetical protein
MTDDQVLKTVGAALDRTQGELLRQVVAFKDRRDTTLAQLDALPLLGAVLIEELMKELAPHANH